MSQIMMDCPRCWGRPLKCTYCNGARRIPDVQLSPNFRLSEMLDSVTARRDCIQNNPPPEVVDNLRRLCVEGLEPVRALAGPLRINSGYRSSKLNDVVGGSDTSAHSFGLAADIVPVDCTWRQLMDKVIAAKIPVDQLIYEHTWVHFGLLHPKTMRQRGEYLTMNVVRKKATYVPYITQSDQFV